MNAILLSLSESFQIDCGPRCFLLKDFNLFNCIRAEKDAVSDDVGPIFKRSALHSWSTCKDFPHCNVVLYVGGD